MEKSITLPVTFTICFTGVMEKSSPDSPLDVVEKMKKLAPPRSSLDADVFPTSREERETDIVTRYKTILCLDKEIEYETDGLGIACYDTEEDLKSWALQFMKKVLSVDTSTQQFEIDEIELSDNQDILNVLLDIEASSHHMMH